MKITKNKFLSNCSFYWFTLVELIVVITILSILGTIGFISIQGYSSSARDSTRISNLVNLHKGLSIYQMGGGILPMPESPITIMASGTIIGYQWFAKDQVANVAKLSAGATKDPLDPTIFTTYSVNALQTKMQLMSFLEDGSKITAFIPSAFGVTESYAATSAAYASRSPMTKGDSVGILIGTGTMLNQPVQELLTESFTGIDIAGTATGYTVIFSKDVSASWTGSILITTFSIQRPDGKILAGYDPNLKWFWNMETLSGTVLKDFSQNGNTLTCYQSATVIDCAKSSEIVPKHDMRSYVTFTSEKWATLAISKSELVKTPNYTMTSWLRIQDSPTDGNIGRVIFSNYSNLHGSIFYIKTNNKIALRPHGMNTNIDFASNTDLQYNQWYFVSATFNGSTANLYINGKLDGTASFIWYDPIDSGIAWFVWSSPWWDYVPKNDITNTNFKGDLSEQRFYSRALSDAEILNLYNATNK